MHPLDWVLLCVYFALIIVIAVAALRTVRTGSDFAVAGARLPTSITVATLSAAYIGGSFSIGAAGATFRDGYVYLFALLGFPVATVLIGVWVAPRLREYAAETLGDVMEHHYGQPARIITGLLSVAVCAAILGLQVLALGVIANTFLGIDTKVASVALTLLVLLYSTTGGLWADVRADALHFVVLGVFTPVAVLVALAAAGGGHEVAASVPETHLSFLGEWSLGHYLSLLVGFMFGETLMPAYAQRAFAGSSPRSVRTGFVVAGLFGMVFLVVTTTAGTVARALYPTIDSDQAVPVLVDELLPVGLTGLAVAAFVAAIMSSADSFLNSTTVVVVRDLWTRGQRRQMTERKRLLLQRVVNLVVGVSALAVALSLPTLFDVLIIYYSLWAPTVIVPLILGVVFKLRGPAAGVSAMLAGLAATAVWTWGLKEPFGILGLAVGVVTNAATFAVVYTVGRRRRGRRTDAAPAELSSTRGAAT